MRTHGWSGAWPTSDDEAIERILDAACAVIDECGEGFRIAEVARRLGVSRQTLYAYFPGADALRLAAAIRSGMRFTERLTAHSALIGDPVDILVEALAYTLEWLPNDKPVQLVLAHDPRSAVGVTSDTTMQFGRTLLQSLDIDWEGYGFDVPLLDDLAEYLLRVLQSYMIDPGRSLHSAVALRENLRRWIGPVVGAEIRRAQQEKSAPR